MIWLYNNMLEITESFTQLILKQLSLSSTV